MLTNVKYANKCQICSQMSNMLTNVKHANKCEKNKIQDNF